MTDLGIKMLRAAVALQVAVLEREDEDLNSTAGTEAISRIVKEITSLDKKIKAVDL